MFNRREFVGLGALSLCANLLPHRCFSDVGSVSAKLKFEKITIKAGAARPFGALHVSDTHLASMDAEEAAAGKVVEYVGKRGKHFADAPAMFAATLKYVEKKKLPILHTGDLVDFMSERNFAIAKPGFVGANKMLVSRGNHDYWNPADPKGQNWRADQQRVKKVFPNDLVCAAREINGVNFVAIDNGDGQIGEHVFGRMKAEFDKGMPVVLLMHVPFYSEKLFNVSFYDRGGGKTSGTASLTGVPAEKVTELYRGIWKTRDLPHASTVKAIEFLKVNRQLKAVLCGHLHFAYSERFSETAVQYVAGGHFNGEGYEISFT